MREGSSHAAVVTRCASEVWISFLLLSSFFFHVFRSRNRDQVLFRFSVDARRKRKRERKKKI